MYTGIASSYSCNCVQSWLHSPIKYQAFIHANSKKLSCKHTSFNILTNSLFFKHFSICCNKVKKKKIRYFTTIEMLYTTILHNDYALTFPWSHSKAAARLNYKSSTAWWYCVLCYCNKLRTKFTDWEKPWRGYVHRICAGSQYWGVIWLKCAVSMYWHCSRKMERMHAHTHIIIKRCTKNLKNDCQHWKCKCSEQQRYSAGEPVLNMNLSHRCRETNEFYNSHGYRLPMANQSPEDWNEQLLISVHGGQRGGSRMVSGNLKAAFPGCQKSPCSLTSIKMHASLFNSYAS